MITIAPAPGALYPVVTVPALPSADALLGDLRGAPWRPLGDGRAVFSIWDAPALARHYGQPEDPDSLAHLRWIERMFSAVAMARDGTHPWMAAAPGILKPHQRAAWCMLMECPFGAVFHEPGLGKTATAITSVDAKRQRDLARGRPVAGTLVLCPVTLIYDTWTIQLEQWGPSLSVANLHADMRLADIPYDVWLINPERLREVRASLPIRLLRAGLGRIIVDESSTMKNPDALFTKAVLGPLGDLPERYVLSGRPAPNGEREYWPQVNLVAPGLLGATDDEFTKTWFEHERGQPRSAMRVKNGLLPALMERVGRVSLYTPEEVIDLPPPIFEPRYCDLSPKLRDAYDLMRRELATVVPSDDHGRVSARVLAKIMRLRELANGYIVDSEKRWHLVGTHKFDLLESVLREIGEHQVIVWCTFVEDFPAIARLLPHRHARAGYIWGGTRKKAYRASVLRDFRAGKLQYMFANPRTLKYGVTMFDAGAAWACSRAIDLNISYSLEDFEQAHYRNRRIGQPYQNYYYPLLTRNTIEEPIYERLQAKRDDSDRALEFLR